MRKKNKMGTGTEGIKLGRAWWVQIQDRVAPSEALLCQSVFFLTSLLSFFSGYKLKHIFLNKTKQNKKTPHTFLSLALQKLPIICKCNKSSPTVLLRQRALPFLSISDVFTAFCVLVRCSHSLRSLLLNFTCWSDYLSVVCKIIKSYLPSKVFEKQFAFSSEFL